MILFLNLVAICALGFYTCAWWALIDFAQKNPAWFRVWCNGGSGPRRLVLGVAIPSLWLISRLFA